tara:strand:- start:1590 stop:4337 length:2748 start_codon:yes stop_codon:yes gene_type:complete
MNKTKEITILPSDVAFLLKDKKRHARLPFFKNLLDRTKTSVGSLAQQKTDILINSGGYEPYQVHDLGSYSIAADDDKSTFQVEKRGDKNYYTGHAVIDRNDNGEWTIAPFDPAGSDIGDYTADQADEILPTAGGILTAAAAATATAPSGLGALVAGTAASGVGSGVGELLNQTIATKLGAKEADKGAIIEESIAGLVGEIGGAGLKKGVGFLTGPKGRLIKAEGTETALSKEAGDLSRDLPLYARTKDKGTLGKLGEAMHLRPHGKLQEASVRQARQLDEAIGKKIEKIREPSKSASVGEENLFNEIEEPVAKQVANLKTSIEKAVTPVEKKAENLKTSIEEAVVESAEEGDDWLLREYKAIKNAAEGTIKEWWDFNSKEFNSLTEEIGEKGLLNEELPLTNATKIIDDILSSENLIDAYSPKATIDQSKAFSGKRSRITGQLLSGGSAPAENFLGEAFGPKGKDILKIARDVKDGAVLDDFKSIDTYRRNLGSLLKDDSSPLIKTHGLKAKLEGLYGALVDDLMPVYKNAGLEEAYERANKNFKALIDLEKSGAIKLFNNDNRPLKFFDNILKLEKEEVKELMTVIGADRIEDLPNTKVGKEAKEKLVNGVLKKVLDDPENNLGALSAWGSQAGISDDLWPLMESLKDLGVESKTFLGWLEKADAPKIEEAMELIGNRENGKKAILALQKLALDSLVPETLEQTEKATITGTLLSKNLNKWGNIKNREGLKAILGKGTVAELEEIAKIVDGVKIAKENFDRIFVRAHSTIAETTKEVGAGTSSVSTRGVTTRAIGWVLGQLRFLTNKSLQQVMDDPDLASEILSTPIDVYRRSPKDPRKKLLEKVARAVTGDFNKVRGKRTFSPADLDEYTKYTKTDWEKPKGMPFRRGVLEALGKGVSQLPGRASVKSITEDD